MEMASIYALQNRECHHESSELFTKNYPNKIEI
jgi:hypothetical protein